ncbi:MAG TPA: hypothetical protein VMC04_20900 [Verrucomicrobiae bacterium]|jgi:hypothetical protein|nr:hypothetical protein [Verrucomicrobiae bacterium]
MARLLLRQGRVVVRVAAVVAAIGLSASPGAAVEPKVTIPGAVPPTPQVERLSDEQVRTEFRRLSTMKIECGTQARQALAAQQTASAAGRASEAEAQGQLLWTRMTCLEEANQGLVRLRNQATRDQLPLLSLGDGLRQEYRRGLQSHLTTLQQVSKQLADPSAFTAATFATQMDTLRRQWGTFRNRYIRLLNDPETQGLAASLFQAGDLLIGSAQVWGRQVKAEAEIAELSRNGSGPQLERAQAAREAAVTERARQWELAQRLILQATTLAATH